MWVSTIVAPVMLRSSVLCCVVLCPDRVDPQRHRDGSRFQDAEKLCEYERLQSESGLVQRVRQHAQNVLQQRDEVGLEEIVR